jgi:hypothetical protein
MAQQTTDPNAGGTMGSQPSQGVFLGRFALVLLGLMAVFTLAVLGSAAFNGFS